MALLRDPLNDRIFNISIYNGKSMFLSSFLANFIDRYNTQVYNRIDQLRDGNESSINVFYSCGDKNFTYDVTKLFIGPDFIMKNINYNVT